MAAGPVIAGGGRSYSNTYAVGDRLRAAVGQSSMHPFHPNAGERREVPVFTLIHLRDTLFVSLLTLSNTTTNNKMCICHHAVKEHTPYIR